jgi:hypothetical protein
VALGVVEHRVRSALGGEAWAAEFVRCSGTSGHHLTIGVTELAVEIVRWTLNRGDTWTVIGDQTLRLVRPVDLTDSSGRIMEAGSRGPTTLFKGASYLSHVAGSCSLSWPFLLRIHPSEHSHLSLTHPT